MQKGRDSEMKKEEKNMKYKFTQESEKRLAACRRNALKGGRPKKKIIENNC